MRGLVLVMRGNAENHRVGKCRGRSSNGVSPPVFWKAQSRSSASVLHVRLAEDLCIWVMLVVGGGTEGVGPFNFSL